MQDIHHECLRCHKGDIYTFTLKEVQVNEVIILKEIKNPNQINKKGRPTYFILETTWFKQSDLSDYCTRIQLFKNNIILTFSITNCFPFISILLIVHISTCIYLNMNLMIV